MDFRIFNVHTDSNACNCTQGVQTHVRESALKVDSGRGVINMLKRAGLSDSNCCSEPVSYAAVKEYSTSGLDIEVFNESEKVGANVVLQ